jgi:hypothetical protein
MTLGEPIEYSPGVPFFPQINFAYMNASVGGYDRSISEDDQEDSRHVEGASRR